MQIETECDRKLKVNSISDKNGQYHETERSISRKQENTDFTSVIIKRNDHSVRHPDDILELATLIGVEQHKRPGFSLFLSSLSAGLILGFAGMCVALTSQLFSGTENFQIQRLSIALVYPLGFIVSIISGTQLFTEHTATALYPVLDGRVKIKSLLTLWGIVLIGNLCGTFCSSVLLFLSDSMINASSGFVEISNELLLYTASEVFTGAILAGWLMAQAGWLVLASPSTVGQILCIYIITFIIGYGGLPHSIAGASEIFSGLFHSKNPSYWGSAIFIVSAALGNLFGGTLFVGVLNYAHIKKMQ
jgi:formate-nitrite transporter family protein